MATPMAAETNRLGSFVSFLENTQKVICPGFKEDKPASFDIILQFGGKILETKTRLHFSIPASLRASSKEANLSLWTPTPLVKNIFVGKYIFKNERVYGLY